MPLILFKKSEDPLQDIRLQIIDANIVSFGCKSCRLLANLPSTCQATKWHVKARKMSEATAVSSSIPDIWNNSTYFRMLHFPRDKATSTLSQ